MYQLVNLPPAPVIVRLSDSATIPADAGNVDYQQYLVWVAAGNTPEPL